MQMEPNGQNDFDFFIGCWKAHNRRLRERLKGSKDWEEIERVVSLPLLLYYRNILSLGTSLFNRRWKNMGNQLDLGVNSTRLTI